MSRAKLTELIFTPHLKVITIQGVTGVLWEVHREDIVGRVFKVVIMSNHGVTHHIRVRVVD